MLSIIYIVSSSPILKGGNKIWKIVPGGNEIFEKSEGEWKRGGNADFLHHKEGGLIIPFLLTCQDMI